MRVRLPQHETVPQQLEQNVIVAEEDESERQRVVPALGAQQRVQLIQHHARLDPDQQVQDPQRLVEEELLGEEDNIIIIIIIIIRATQLYQTCDPGAQNQAYGSLL